MSEESMLTREQVEWAKKDRSHIVVQTLNSFGKEYWKKTIMQANLYNEDNQIRQQIYNESFLPFAIKLEGQLFTLNSLEIISIWSRADELFPKLVYPKYSLSTNLALVYGTALLNLDEWKELPKDYPISGSEFTRKLTKLSNQDSQSASVMRKRLREIDKSLREIDRYCQREDQNDSLFDQIHENWSNGMYWMFLCLGKEAGR